MHLLFSLRRVAVTFYFLGCLGLCTETNAQQADFKRVFDLFLSQGAHIWTVDATLPFGNLKLDAQTHWIVPEHKGHHTSRFSYQGAIGALEGFLNATLDGPTGTLSLAIQKGQLASDVVRTPEILGDFTITLPVFEVGASLETLLQTTEPITFKGNLHTGVIHIPHPGLTIAPMSLHITGRGVHGVFEGIWHLTDKQKSVTLQGTWKAGIQEKFFELQGTSGPLTFGDKGILIQDLITLEDGTPLRLDGALDLSGRITWASGAWTPKVTAVFKDMSVIYGKMGFSDLNAHLDILSFWPLITQGVQTLTCSRLNVGVPLHHIKFRLEGTKDRFRLHEGRVGMDLGTLDIQPFETAWTEPNFRTILSLQNLPFQPVIDILELDDLHVTGRITGTLPLHIQNNQVAIESARFVAVETGTLCYKPAGSENQIAKLDADDFKVPDNPLDLVNLALQDFRYNDFTLTANKPLDGETVAVVSLKGFNPILLKGYPFQFQVNIAGPLEDVLQTALLSLGHASIGNIVNDETLREVKVDS